MVLCYVFSVAQKVPWVNAPPPRQEVTFDQGPFKLHTRQHRASPMFKETVIVVLGLEVATLSPAKL